MKTRFTKKENFDAKDVEFFVEKGIAVEMAKVLSIRGATKENFDSFFSASQQNFHDPFLMSGMKEAVAVLNRIFQNNGRVLIYGDYDADGLTAASLLSLFFSHNGVANEVYIPTREQGYGISSVDSILHQFEKNPFDLFLTVDCGISNKAEIELLKQKLKNVEFIVTDHHEVPDVLPDCICLNPKISGYPYQFLSGSGVAWKLVSAISGFDNAKNYADLATVGTIADVMPLTDENRALVKLGLQNFNHKGLSSLAEVSKCGKTVSSSDIAMKIAPKINAAGRMGDPSLALELLLQCEKSDSEIALKLVEKNEQRRADTEAILQKVQSEIDLKKVRKDKLVFVCGDWNSGLSGIVASRLKEQFQLPAVVLTEVDGKLAGSARGTENINLHEIFKNAEEFLLSFGGHKNAAGFSLERKNLQKLQNCLSNQLKNLDSSLFLQNTYYDMDFDGSTSILDLYNFSQALEPVAPSDSLTVRVRDFVEFANAFGSGSNHLNISLSCGLEVKAFYKFSKLLKALRTGAEVDMLLTLSFDNFSNSVLGILQEIEFNNSLHFEEIYKVNIIENVDFAPQQTFVSPAVAKSILQRQSVLAVFDCFDDFSNASKTIDFSDFFQTFFSLRQFCDKCVVISPEKDFDYDLFSNVVVFSNACSLQRSYTKDAVFVKTKGQNLLWDLEIDRDVCTLVYKALKNKNRFESLETAFSKYLLGKVSYLQFTAATKIFCELGLLKIHNQFDVEFCTSDKTHLECSTIFKSLQKNLQKLV